MFVGAVCVYLLSVLHVCASLSAGQRAVSVMFVCVFLLRAWLALHRGSRYFYRVGREEEPCQVYVCKGSSLEVIKVE